MISTFNSKNLDSKREQNEFNASSKDYVHARAAETAQSAYYDPNSALTFHHLSIARVHQLVPSNTSENYVHITKMHQRITWLQD